MVLNSKSEWPLEDTKVVSDGLMVVARCGVNLGVTMCIVCTETSWGELESFTITFNHYAILCVFC